MARQFLWFPKLNEEIIKITKSCDACQSINQNSITNRVPWPVVDRAWQRIHIDYAKFETVNLLILVDVFSKWMEVCVVKNLTAEVLINKLFKVFSRFGTPESCTLDNGPPFTSSEFTSRR
jgi:hypothetical protein